MAGDTRSIHYVNPKEFYAEMVEFHASHSHLPKGVRPQKIPDSVGKKIMLICERLSYSRQFYGSPHREEMVLDAIETCITYIRNFDPSISKNPFAYFTQLAYYSFIQRAGKEKKEFMTKVSFVQNLAIHEDIAMSSSSVDGADDHHVEFTNNLSVYLNYNHTPKVDEFSAVKRPKRTTLAYQKKQKDAAKDALDLQVEEALKEPSVLDLISPHEEVVDLKVSQIEDLI